MKSLKNRLIIALVALVGIVGVLNACGSYLIVRKQTDNLLDAHLEGAAVWLAAGNIASMGSDGPPEHSVDGFVGQVWRRDVATPVHNTDPSIVLNRHAPRGFSDELVTGADYRVYTLVSHNGDYVYQVAQPESFRQGMATQAALEALVPTPILILLVWLAIPFVVRVTFSRLSRAREKAESINLGNLEPLDVRGVPAEVMPFASSVNVMIDRLRISIESEKQFIADAAHELRTPIAVLQLQADNLANAVDEAERVELQTELRTGIVRTANMIRQLLGLARADSHLDPAALNTVDLPPFIVGLVSELLPVANSRQIDIGVNRLEALSVRAKESELKMAVKNILENALRYTQQGGSVDFDVYQEDGAAVIQVRDTGPGIPEALLPRVFDRFFRASPSDSDGTGLGLSIVKAVVTKYAGDVVIENRSDGCSGLVATIRLPGCAKNEGDRKDLSIGVEDPDGRVIPGSA
jgi:two-component system, OmpR family, sensor kinase